MTHLSTSYNLDVWFNTWKDLLIDLGFGKLATPGNRVEGEIKFSPGAMDRIISVDETDGSLDERTGQRPSLHQTFLEVVLLLTRVAIQQP
jgi:hypothetical protein